MWNRKLFKNFRQQKISMEQAKMIGIKAKESKLTKEYLDADTIIIATNFRPCLDRILTI